MEITIRTRQLLWGEFHDLTVEAELFSLNPKQGGEVTAAIVACDNVNVTHLALRSFRQAGEEDLMDSVFWIDNGSVNTHTFDLMRMYIEMRGEGRALRLKDNILHQGALEILGQTDLITTKRLLLFDNDIEIEHKGGYVAALALMTPKTFAVGAERFPYNFQVAEHLNPLGRVNNWTFATGVGTGYVLWDMDLYRKGAREVGATGFYDNDQQIFYDNLCKMTEYLIKQGYELKNWDFTRFVKHYGAMSVRRRGERYSGKGIHVADIDVLYDEITTRLRGMGVPESYLFDDRRG